MAAAGRNRRGTGGQHGRPGLRGQLSGPSGLGLAPGGGQRHEQHGVFGLWQCRLHRWFPPELAGQGHRARYLAGVESDRSWCAEPGWPVASGDRRRWTRTGGVSGPARLSVMPTAPEPSRIPRAMALAPTTSIWTSVARPETIFLIIRNTILPSWCKEKTKTMSK